MKIEKMLPTELENLVGHYAYGVGRYNLVEEVDFLAANRGMIPDAFLAHAMPLDGHFWRNPPPLVCYMVPNPLRTDNPFFPWALLDKASFVFGNSFYWWFNQIKPHTFKELRTYRATVEKHVVALINRGSNMAPEWNFFLSRYLSQPYLLDPTNYHTLNHENMFSLICDQLKNSGYLTPLFSLPPRPSRRTVLLRPSELLV